MDHPAVGAGVDDGDVSSTPTHPVHIPGALGPASLPWRSCPSFLCRGQEEKLELAGRRISSWAGTACGWI
jgi:hypothetical protein